MFNNKTIAIVPGSFDPITIGHIYIIKEAAKRYDKVFVAVMINADKSYMFSLDERKNIAYAAVKDIDNVEVITSNGWLYELANSLSADAIVKGYRNDIDLEYENQMAKFNAEHAPNAKTVLIKSDSSIENISSTLIRKKITNGESLNTFLPQEAIDEIEKIILTK